MFPQLSDHFVTPSHPVLPTLPSQINSTTTPATATPGNPKPQCPACGLKLTRRKDLDRHISTHLPHWIHCPLPHCSWRGNRIKSIDSTGSDRITSGTTSPMAALLDKNNSRYSTHKCSWIKAGTISTSDAAAQALIIVAAKANQLQKPSMSENRWATN